MTVLPFAEWRPDMPDLAEATTIATNCVALTEESYGPVNSFVQYSYNALNGPCVGAELAEDVALNTYVYAATATDLFEISPSSNNWNNVSSSPGAYTTATGDNFRFAQYKQLMLATNYANPIQSMTLGSGAFAELSTGAPNARHIAVAKSFCIVANTSDPVGGVNPDRVWWSAANDPTNWPTPGTPEAQQTQSDYDDIPGYQGGITGLVPNLTGVDCAVFFERGIQSMIYVGPPDVFNFYPVVNSRGCRFPNALVDLGSMVYYPAEDGFYSFDGSNFTPLGAQKFDKWFLANVDQAHPELVIGAPDVTNRAIMWMFKSIYNTSLYPDMALYYRWDIGRATPLQGLNLQWITRTAVPAASSYLPPQNAALIKNALQLAGITYPGNWLAYPTGIPLPAQIATKAVQITPGYRSFVRSVRPLCGVGSGTEVSLSNESGVILTNESGIVLTTEPGSGTTLTAAVSARTNYSDSEIFGVDVAVNSMGECPQRSDGRYHRFRVTLGRGPWGPGLGVDVQAVRSGLR